MHDSLLFKTRTKLTTSNEHNENLVFEITSTTGKNTLINITYRPPSGQIKPFYNYLKSFFDQTKNENKDLYFVGDFNSCDSRVTKIFNLLLKHGNIPLITKHTRVTRQTATIIDHIFTNCYVKKEFVTGILKSCIPDHFPIFVIANTIIGTENKQNEKRTIFQRNLSPKNISNLIDKLKSISWNNVFSSNNANTAYNNLLLEFSEAYYHECPIIESKLVKKNFTQSLDD